MKYPTSTPIDLSIVIVSYNTFELTSQCVTSILGLDTELAIEIIVVDNASPDDSGRQLAARHPEISVIDSGGNHGFSFANNLGFAAARGKFILCLNPDTLVGRDALEEAKSYLENHRDVAMVGVRLRDENGDEGVSAMRFLTPLHFLLLALLPKELVARLPIVGDTRYQSKPLTDTFTCDAVVGCFMMFRREVLDEVGGLDDRFFMYGEEVEWSHRIRRAGHEIAYLGGPSILHYGGASTANLARWKLIAMANGQILAQAKMYGRWAGKATNVSMILGQVLRLPVWLVMALAGRREPLANNWAKLTFLLGKLFAPISAHYRKGAR